MRGKCALVAQIFKYYFGISSDAKNLVLLLRLPPHNLLKYRSQFSLSRDVILEVITQDYLTYVIAQSGYNIPTDRTKPPY